MNLQRIAVALIGAAVILTSAPTPKKKRGAPPIPVEPLQAARPAKLAGPAEIYPDSALAPGALNANVTQDNIGQNICNTKWTTSSIRPPSPYTTALKRQQLKAAGKLVHQTNKALTNPKTGKIDTSRCAAHSDNLACYEEDHLISLQNGGHPRDPQNLWPEPYTTKVDSETMGARQKDLVENFIHDSICFSVPNSKKTSGKFHPRSAMTLRRGQEILAIDWYACYLKMTGGQDCE
jgi:hypothetical protein